MLAEKKLVANSRRNANGRQGDAQLRPYVEEHAEQGEEVRGLAHEEVVEEDVGDDEDEPRYGSGKAPEGPRQPLARGSP